MDKKTITKIATVIVVCMLFGGLYYWLSSGFNDPTIREKISATDQKVVSLDATAETFGKTVEIHREVVERKVEIIREKVPEHVRSLAPDELIDYTVSTIERFRDRSKDSSPTYSTRLDSKH